MNKNTKNYTLQKVDKKIKKYEKKLNLKIFINFNRKFISPLLLILYSTKPCRNR